MPTHTQCIAINFCAKSIIKHSFASLLAEVQSTGLDLHPFRLAARFGFYDTGMQWVAIVCHVKYNRLDMRSLMPQHGNLLQLHRATQEMPSTSCSAISKLLQGLVEPEPPDTYRDLLLLVLLDCI